MRLSESQSGAVLAWLSGSCVVNLVTTDWIVATSSERTLAHPREVGSGIESEDDLVRFLVAPISEPAALAHDHETALLQHANRRGVVARSASVKRTGCLQLQELL